MRDILRAGLCAVLVALAACGANTLRVESAKTVSTASDATVKQARAALDYAKQTREQANATLVASDPSCRPGESLRILVPSAAWTPRLPPAPLCATGSRPPRGYDVERVALDPISDEALKPTLLLIAAVAEYGGALAKVADRPNVDISAELNGIAAKANEAVVIANSLLGANIPEPVKLLATSQASTAIAVLQFIETLSAEAARVRDIRALVARRGADIDAIVPELRAQLARWLELTATGDAQVYVNNLRRAYASQRGRMEFEGRLAFVRLVNQARADVDAIPARHQALSRALDTFVAAQLELREHLAGRFSDEDRRRIARINRDRIIEALGLVARTMGAFGVSL